MRVYVEMFEVVSEEEIREGDFIRVDVTGKTDEEIQNTINEVLEIASRYEKVVVQIHECGHDEGKQCDTKVVMVK